MSGGLAMAMFPVLLIVLLSGYPVALCLAGCSLIFALLGEVLGVFVWSDMSFVPHRIYGIMQKGTLIAVPLFIFMGTVLEGAGISRELLGSAARLLRGGRVGLALSVVIIGAVLAASTGIVGATVVTMGLLSLPMMLSYGYSPSFSSGLVAASGTLGQIIPPSIVLILLGEIMGVDIGSLFLGAMIPSLLLVFLYIVYVLVFAKRQGAADKVDDVLAERLSLAEFLAKFLGPALLVVVVLGSILWGIATPTEAGACGASFALVLVSLKKRMSLSLIRSSCEKTVVLTSMVFFILIAAQFFGVVFRGLGGDDVVVDLLHIESLSPGWTLAFIMVLIFLLGFFLDFLEICFIVIPIVMPTILGLRLDPLWVAILFALNLQTSFLTPPFGFSLFYLRGVAPDQVATKDIYRGILPFVGIQILMVVLVAIFPGICTWLPAYLNQ